MRVVSIFGGTGFIGTELIHELEKKDYEIRLFTRKKIPHTLNTLSKTRFIQLRDDTKLSNELIGSDIIIDLVGILHEQKGITFDDVHSGRLKKLSKIAQKLNIKRFIHIGALGASVNAPSKYLQSKGKGEKHIKKQCSNLAWTIYKPSIVFGIDDKFVNLFHNIISFTPIIGLISPHSMFQPIWVKDLVDIIINGIDDKKTFQKAFNVAGPTSYSFMGLIKLISHHRNKKIIIVPLGKRLSYIIVTLMELLPIKIITRDNLKSMSIDSTVKVNDAYKFKSALMGLESYLEAKNK